MAEEVVSFLDRASVLNCMRNIPQFQFLTNYYCSDHGSKLECQKALREQLRKKKPWMTNYENNDDANDDASSEHANKKQKMMECEDCVLLDHDYDRCPFCEKFEYESDMMACCKPECGKKACSACCHDIGRIDLGYCEACEEWACFYCESYFSGSACNQSFCATCRKSETAVFCHDDY